MPHKRGMTVVQSKGMSSCLLSEAWFGQCWRGVSLRETCSHRCSAVQPAIQTSRPTLRVRISPAPAGHC
eukprot:11188261-Lingulodinium_polyedra.AAC.1